MARIKTTEGNGLTLTYHAITGGTVSATGTLIGGITDFTGGGYTREMLDDTDLSNAEWTTKVAAALKTADDVTFTLKAAAPELPEDNGKWVVSTTRGTAVSISFYGQVSASGSRNYANATAATRSVTVTPTCIDEAGEESGVEITVGAGA